MTLSARVSATETKTTSDMEYLQLRTMLKLTSSA
jgi:hypothetical protein